MIHAGFFFLPTKHLMKFNEWIHSLNFVCFTKPKQPNVNLKKNWERNSQREGIVLKWKQEETIQDINEEEIKPTAKRTHKRTHTLIQHTRTIIKMARNTMQKSKKTWIKIIKKNNNQQKENQNMFKRCRN